jgi:hypothetical protein
MKILCKIRICNLCFIYWFFHIKPPRDPPWVPRNLYKNHKWELRFEKSTNRFRYKWLFIQFDYYSKFDCLMYCNSLFIYIIQIFVIKSIDGSAKMWRSRLDYDSSDALICPFSVKIFVVPLNRIHIWLASCSNQRKLESTRGHHFWHQENDDDDEFLNGHEPL